MSGGALPNLVIIGAMKCATTSLHRYLGAHPQICMSREKELNFFAWETEWARGMDWYRSWFDPDAPVRGEASPSYTNFPILEGVPERMHGVIPEARLIFLVRDPLDRLKAHYRHKVAARQEDEPILDVWDDPGRALISRSLYAWQLEQYLPFYPLEQILVVQQERLLEDRDRELERIFRFLGVDPSFKALRFRYRFHRSARKRRLTPAGVRLSELPGLRSLDRLPGLVRWPLEDLVYWPFSDPVPLPELPAVVEARLLEGFAKDVERLRELTGQAFEGWRV
ncbi:MAG: sulfotransferase [Gemmatimonadota bacterium]|jgi:hypothetical protein